MARVLFVCTHNAGRSQMAQAFMERLAGSRHQARSAGAMPAAAVHPEVAKAMREVGIALDSRRPQRLTPELVAWADLVVTMGCGDACPAVPGKQRLEWSLPDPQGQPQGRVREIRDLVRKEVERLVRSLDGGPAVSAGEDREASGGGGGC